MKSFVAAAAVVLLLPTIALAQKTSFDFDKSADFSKFKTYALKDGTKVGDPLIDNRIVAAIEAELASKGFTKNATKPDIVVVYHVAFDKQKDITAYRLGRLRRLRLSVWRRLGREHDQCTRQRNPRGYARHRCDRREQAGGRVARHGRQGSRHTGKGRKAGQEHQRGGGEDPQELSHPRRSREMRQAGHRPPDWIPRGGRASRSA